MIEQYGVIEFSVAEVLDLLEAIQNRRSKMGVYHEQISNKLDRALRWELLNADGSVQGRFTYFPSREAEHNAGSWENVLNIRDRHTSAIHRRIPTRWTMKTLADLGVSEPQLEDIPPS